MTIKPMKTFERISQRILYGLNFMYSEFEPIESDKADAQSQRKLHRLMGQIIDRLYENPELLNLADNEDEAYEWYAVNNTNPALDNVYKSIFKRLYDFYKFLYISFLLGEADNDHFTVSNTILRENKASYIPQYKTMLKEFGINIDKGKTGIIFIAENDIIKPCWRILKTLIMICRNIS